MPEYISYLLPLQQEDKFIMRPKDRHFKLYIKNNTMSKKYSAIASTAVLTLTIALAGCDVEKVFLDSSTLKNDLSGSFSASVKLAQTHTIDVKNNSQQEMPGLISTRDTLVMLIPHVSAESVTLLVRDQEKKLLGQLEMLPPEKLPQADRPDDSQNPNVVYSNRAWSQILPADWVQPGMTIEFQTPTLGRTGYLKDIDIGGETQVVLQNIRIGMLTAPGPLDNNPLEKESQNWQKIISRKSLYLNSLWVTTHL